jgi:hypothetical protein
MARLSVRRHLCLPTPWAAAPKQCLLSAWVALSKSWAAP